MEQSRRISVPASIDMVNVLGPGDEFLRILERELEADLHVRGNDFTLTGSAAAVALAAEVITELVTVLRTGQGLSADAVERIVSMLTAREEARPADVLTHNILSSRGRTIRPKTLNQKRYVDAIDKHTVVFGIGPAGTGKTYLAVAKAVQALQNKQVNRIILTRPAVEAGERLGFLPGTLNDKIDPYLRPLYDALHDMVDPDSIPRLLTAGTIEVAPLAYMRGRTLNDAFIILDEAQNTSMEQMKMFLTRLGFGSKIVVTGDITQVDLPGGTRSGLRAVQGVLDDVEDISFNYLTNHDVVRHKLVGRIVAAYDRYEATLPSPRAPASLDGATLMAVDIANESGQDADTAGLVAARLVRTGAAAHPSPGRAVHPAGGRGDDELLPREVSGRARSDRRAVLPDGRTAPAGRQRRAAGGAARRRRAVSGRHLPAGGRTRADRDRRGGVPAGARVVAPAGLRSRRSGATSRDVRSEGQDPGRLGDGPTGPRRRLGGR